MMAKSRKLVEWILSVRWDAVFRRRPPTPVDLADAEDVLSRLTKSPLACARLAEWLDVQTDGKESAADVVAYAASRCAHQLDIEWHENRLQQVRHRGEQYP